jgi:hypothetical protein
MAATLAETYGAAILACQTRPEKVHRIYGFVDRRGRV